MPKAEITERFVELIPKYEQLGQLTRDAITTLLRKAQIDFLDVTYRVKKLDSFLDKVQRKRFKTPFEDVCDICGLRIVCFYPTDLERIAALIGKEFVVGESIDKGEDLEPDRFGYRSLHFVVRLKDQWLDTPQYRELGGLKFEIQLRTIMMHAWAGLSHKLAYKKKQQVPDEFLRRLFQLSALFEVADEQFDILQRAKLSYQEKAKDATAAAGAFDLNQPLNVDTVQAFLDSYFPTRLTDHDFTSDLLEEIAGYGISVGDLVRGYDEARSALTEIEQKQLGSDNHWAQVGAARTILELTNNDYWEARQEWMADNERSLKSKWRKKINKARP